MKDKAIVTIFGVGCVTVIEIMALFNGVDGQILATSLATIAGIVGYMFGRR